MAAPQLFDDQLAVVDDIRAAFDSGARSVLLVLPTGGGKTVIFSHITRRLVQNGRRVVLLVHRAELLDQVSSTLSWFEVLHGYIAANFPHDAAFPAHVASAQTLVRRAERLPAPDFVIIDEAHHAIPDSIWAVILDTWRARNPNLRVLGVTATPERLDGSGLGDIFEGMVEGPTTGQLIQMGRLSRYVLLEPSKVDLEAVKRRGGDFDRRGAAEVTGAPKIVGDVVKHYADICKGAPAVAFCASVANAEALAAELTSKGFLSRSIDGGLAKSVRRDLVAGFRDGHFKVLTSCDLISEGFDLPQIHAAILLRPTMSLAMYLQQVGRALRVAPGKDRALILDHVGNNFRHGLPDTDREWTLEGDRDRRKRESSGELGAAVRRCLVCFAISPAARETCGNCGAALPRKPRVVEQVEGQLVEVTPQQIEERKLKLAAAREQGLANSLEALIELGRRRGHKKPEKWAAHVWEAREAKERQRLASYGR